MKGRGLLIAVVAIAAAGVFWRLGKAGEGGAAGWSAPPVKVAVAAAEQVDLPRELGGIGSLEAARQVMVPAEVDGRVVQILFQAGQAVKAGQVLAQLNDAPEQGELARLQAQARNARAVLERTRRLMPQQAATREQFDQAQAEAQQVEGELRRVQALIEQKRIRAPFDGVLGLRRVNLGQFVRAGDPLVSLTDTAVIYANLDLPEQALAGLRVGQSMTVAVDAHGPRRFEGRVSGIEPQVDAGTRSVRVQATLANADGALAAGMYAQGRVQLDGRLRALMVPETAVSYSAFGDSVYVLAPAAAGGAAPTVRQAYVKTGERRDGRIVVSEGLAPGDRVVVSGQVRLHNGAAVEVTASDTLAQAAAASGG